MRAAFHATLRLTLVILFVMSAAVFLFAPQLVRFFRDDPAVVAIGVTALRYACAAICVLPFSVLTNMTLQCSGHALPASFLALMRSGLFFLPILLLLNSLLGIRGIQLAQPIADVLTAAASLPFVIYYFRHLPPEQP